MMTEDLLRLCNKLEIIGYGKKLKFQLKYRILNNDKVRFWYEIGHGRFEPVPISLPRFIPLDKSTFNAFGLIQAESTKENSTFFDFTNSDPELVKFIVDYFNRIWSIDRNFWYGKVLYWKGPLTKKIEGKIKCFWSEFLSIPKERITVKEGTSYRLSETSKSEYGVMSLRLNNKVFRSIALSFLEMVIKPMAEENKKLSSYYFQGLLSGDGSVGFDKNKSMVYVSLAYNPKSNEFDHYEKVLSLLDIDFDRNLKNKIGRRAIQIHNWTNYLKILNLTGGMPFLDKRKNSKFLSGFLSNQYIKSLLRLEKLSKFRNIRYKNYMNLFNVGERNSYSCLQRLVTLGFLMRIKENSFSSYSLTREGRNFLNMIDNIEQEVRWLK